MPLMARDSAIAGLAAPSTRWSLPWLERLGQWLLLALPLVFVLGRSPADVLISLLALLFLLRSATTGGWRWLKTPWTLKSTASDLIPGRFDGISPAAIARSMNSLGER
jgi:hypothetical protein